ncbi:hypothetical protein HIRU_S853 [Hirudovirus strain Sangsue]|uniref:Uncharacterized protein n=1 Tax=Acanthamoeba polyphaga mimivirus TaxID=212035 RepID=A0A0G2Y302_MIMIV|nr:hypothetical protein HIRU_S853 [Hirudovirus strain Sangsue]AKI78879.1 hypothetical protein [Acanthamoeba polyphaga mimivirus]
MEYSEKKEKIFETAEKFGMDFIDLQEKCNFWNQITPTGRRECKEVKKDFMKDFLLMAKNSVDFIEQQAHQQQINQHRQSRNRQTIVRDDNTIDCVTM